MKPHGPLIAAFDRSLLARGQLFDPKNRPELVPSNFDVHEGYKSFLKHALKGLGADAGYIVFCQREGDSAKPDFLVFEGYSLEPSLWTGAFAMKTSQLDTAVQSTTNTLTNNSRATKEHVTLLPDALGHLTIPLLSPDDGAVFASITIESRSPLATPHASVEGDQQELSRLIFDFEERLVRKRLDFAIQVAKQFADEEGDKERFDVILRAIDLLLGPATGKELTEIALLQRVGGTLILRGGRNIPTPPPDIPMVQKEGAGYTAYVGRIRQPFYCPNTFDREAFPEYKPLILTTRSQYTFPLLFRQDLVGVVNVGTPILYGFSTGLRHILEIVASHAAASIFNWRLLNDLRTISGRARDQVRHVQGWLEGQTNTPKFPEDVSRFAVLLARARRMIEEIVYPLQRVNPKPIDVVPVVEGIVEDITLAFKAITSGRTIDISMSFSPHGPIYVEMSGEEFRDVVENLLWNAIEECNSIPTTRITITQSFDEVAARPTGLPPPNTPSRWLELSFRHNGPPLVAPRDGTSLDRHKLHVDRSDSGHGLSRALDLSICDHLLAKYGGYLTLHTPGPQSDFYDSDVRLMMPLKTAIG
jgi:hypothetical protein